MNNRKISARLDALDAAAATTEVAADVTLKFFRGDVFNFHDRLEQNRFALAEAVFHREDRGHFERELARIDFVETSENNVALNIDDRITAENAIEHGFFDTFFDRRDVFARDNAAHDFVFDDQPFAPFAGPQINFHMPVLA